MNRDNARAFSFLHVNDRPPKPRARGVTEIRGPYYTPLGTRQLEDILETMGAYVDALKFAGGSFSLMPRHAVKALIATCHAHEDRRRRPLDQVIVDGDGIGLGVVHRIGQTGADGGCRQRPREKAAGRREAPVGCRLEVPGELQARHERRHRGL